MGARSKRIKRISAMAEFQGLIGQLDQLTKEVHGGGLLNGGLMFRSPELREELGTVWYATPFEVTRDSGPLVRANWQVASTELAAAGSDGVQAHRFGHWGCGWYERLYVRRDSAGALRVLQGLLNRLEEYAALDEDLYSKLEWEENHPGSYAGECYCGDDDCPVPLRELPYVATINMPGYLPESDQPRFETAQEAWGHLAEERQRGEDQVDDDTGEYSTTLTQLRYLASDDHQHGNPHEDWPTAENGTGTVYGPTPGCEGDHDLGLAYSVSWDGDH